MTLKVLRHGSHVHGGGPRHNQYRSPPGRDQLRGEIEDMRLEAAESPVFKAHDDNCIARRRP